MRLIAPHDPSNPTRHSLWSWLMVSLVLPLAGILLLNWDFFVLLLLFWVELAMIGLMGLLRMLFALNGGSWYSSLLPKLFIGAAYLLLFTGLWTIVITFTFTDLDMDTLSNSSIYDGNRFFKFNMILIPLNYLLFFGTNYLMSGEYKTANSLEQLFRTFLYALPLAVIILFAVMPLATRFEGEAIGIFIAAGIVVAKVLVEVGSSVLYYLFTKYDPEKGIPLKKPYPAPEHAEDIKEKL